MPIVAGDLLAYLSGGAANTDPDAALGGARSTTTQIADASTHNLFDIVSSAESSAGDTEYRCFYFLNNHGSLALQNPEIYIQTNTPSGDTNVEIGLDPAGVNGTATTIGDEGSVPAGVVFNEPGVGTPLTPADIPNGQHIAVWVKRVISAAASAVNDDSVIIRIAGDTAA